jgi:opacity protein-like surface antigen
MDDFKFYGIGGLNYSYWKVKTEEQSYTVWGVTTTIPETTASDNEIGLDLGGGANYKQFFGELKYDTGFDQLTISVGMYFDL